MAEALLLGARAVKGRTVRFQWIFCPQVSDRGLFHYHGVVTFPPGTPWRGESSSEADLRDRCFRLRSALLEAASRTPEPVIGGRAKRESNIDVRPLRPEDHPEYMLRWVSFASDAEDSEIILLPPA